MNLRRFVLYDESGARTNVTRRYSRTLGGEGLVDATPRGHWPITNIWFSFRRDGSTTAMNLEGPTVRPALETCVAQLLLSALRPGDIVLVDHLAPHRSPRAMERIQSVGAELWFLPPYSPNYNPIE